MGKSRKKEDEQWLRAFADHLRSHISAKGYVSEYDFWINECGDEISRANLNNILNGKVDPKASTLRRLARGLGMSLSALLRGVES